jgi:hypothetical protein
MSKREETILRSKLPSRGQVLRVFFYRHINLKQETKTSASLVWKEVFSFWEMARISIIRKDHRIEKILSLFEEGKALKKSKGCTKNEEDRQFLLVQRQPGRRGVMASTDMVTFRKEIVPKKWLKSQ